MAGKELISHSELLRVLAYSPVSREEASAAYLAGAQQLYGEFARAA